MVFIVVFCALGNSVRAEQSNAAVVDRWIDQNGEYAYPITPDMEEWNSLGTAQELWDATQIPEEKLSTAYYDEVNAVSLLNILISENNSLLSSFDVVVTYGVSTTNESPISYTIYTPSGTAVSCDYYQNLNYVSSSTYADEVASYPGAILISGASTTFNCHSFAWLQDLYPDTYQHIWLNSVTSFFSDPEYTKLSAPTSASDIAYTLGHSAKVISISKSNPNNHNIPEPFLISKWGPGPVVQHYLSCSPYSATGVQYYAK